MYEVQIFKILVDKRRDFSSHFVDHALKVSAVVGLIGI